MIKRKKKIKWQCGRGEYDKKDDDNDNRCESDSYNSTITTVQE